MKYLLERGMKNIFVLVFLVGFGVMFSGWGYRGHEKIAEKSEAFFEVQMEQFASWIPFLIEHSPDPDTRKSWDDSESPKHYIDIDSYPEFIRNGHVSQNIDTLIVKYGRTFVFDQGILPWATLAAYDSLVNCFRRHDFEKAKYFAADLCHYVADGHMPLHITTNYNGQLTGNKGIHSRYESDMVNRYLTEIDYPASELKHIGSLEDYVFAYHYQSFPYVDSIIAADNYAKTVDQNTTSTAYSSALWDSTHTITVELFRRASYAFSELLYNAWLSAGSPDISKTMSLNVVNNESLHINSVRWQSNDSTIALSFFNPENGLVAYEIRNVEGKAAKRNSSIDSSVGINKLAIDGQQMVPGIYILILRTEKEVAFQKVIVE